MNLKDIKQFGNIELLARQMVEGFITGLHKSPYHGFSVEFAEHRLYNSGESTRYIDWKVFARTDKLFVKRFEEETNLRCHLVLDNSSSMHYPAENLAKIRFSVLAAAAIAYMLQKQRDAVGLTTFSEGIEQQTAVKSTPAHLNKMFALMNGLLTQQTAKRRTNTAETLHLLAEGIHKRSLVIIFSDMMDNFSEQSALFSALQHLKHNKHEILLFHVTDKATEQQFDFEDRPYHFIDLESGQEVKVHPANIRSYYREQVDKQFTALKLKCGQYKIDFIEADVAQSFDQILLPYFIKRSKMH